VGARGYWLLPTLAWFDASDGFLRFLCFGGAALALLLLLELAPAPALFLCWAFYLSLVSVGQIFLGYQWDSLLLETGLSGNTVTPGCPLSPSRSRPRKSGRFGRGLRPTPNPFPNTCAALRSRPRKGRA